MEVEFRTTRDDYVAFYQYFYFRRKLGWRILFVVCYVVPYIRTIRKTRKMLEAPGQLDQKRMILSADGITVKSEDEAGTVTAGGSWRWESVKYVDSTDRFVFIMLFGWEVFLIPRQYFHVENEVDDFIGIIRTGMGRARTGMVRARSARQDSDQARDRRVGKWGYWGLLGLIPNVGAIAGLVLLVLGILYKRSSLIIIAVADMLTTIVFWAFFIHFFLHWAFHGPLVTNGLKQFSRGQLNTVFKSVEFYKLQHGHYPDSLQQVEDVRGSVWITDPLPQRGLRLKSVEFYYQKTGDKYWLFSVGEDGQPFTADDIYPTMDPADSTKFGLRFR